MKKYLILTLLGVSIFIGCSKDDDLESRVDDIGKNSLNIQMRTVDFVGENGSGRSSQAANLSWDHIFGGIGTLVFTNTSTITEIDSTYTVDMIDFVDNGLTRNLINGNYNITLTMNDNIPLAYVPVNATDNFNLSENTSLILSTNTTYGMILLNPYLIDESVPPIFTTLDTDYNLIEDQGFYYLYAPDGTTGVLTIKEGLFGQTISTTITITSSTIDALALAPVTSDTGISLTLEPFTIESEVIDVDAPSDDITPSFGIFTDTGQSLVSTSSSGIVLGDLDNDGDLDAFETKYQSNKIWFNNGNGLFNDSGQELGSSNSEKVALGDLDGDGDLDAIIANWNQPNTMWINDGNGFFSNTGQVLGNSKSESISIGDLDSDGDLDAFVSNNNQPNKVWLNNGIGIFVDSGQDIQNIPRHGSDVSLGDLDGDGDLDAFVTNFNTIDTIWLNDGTGIFIDSGQALVNMDSVDVSLGDIDGDGDLDAFVTNTNNNPNKIWVNNGNGIFSDSGQNIGNTKSKDVSLSDVDGDGDLDIYEVNFSDPDKVWFNDGSGIFTDSGQSLVNPSSSSVYLGDLDGDGDLDAFVVNADENQPNRIWVNN